MIVWGPLVELGLIKLIISILTVVGLAEIAKKVDPTLSGVLLGLPLGAGLTVYFISFEQGVEFLLPGIPWAIAGLSSSLLFCLGYLLVGRQINTKRLLAVVSGSLAAMAAFFISGAFLRSLDLDILQATLLFLAVAAGNFFILRFLPGANELKKNRPLSPKELLVRAFIAGMIITGVTVAAPLAGSRWAGILSSFPSTLYALLVIVHYETGSELYPAIIRGFACSVTTLAVFYWGCLVALPMFGLNLGFALVYAISAIYLYFLHQLTLFIKRREKSI